MALLSDFADRLVLHLAIRRCPPRRPICISLSSVNRPEQRVPPPCETALWMLPGRARAIDADLCAFHPLLPPAALPPLPPPPWFAAPYLYNTQYLCEKKMDYNSLVPAALVGTNVWVLANRVVEVSSGRPSSVWRGVKAMYINGRVHRSSNMQRPQ